MNYDLDADKIGLKSELDFLRTLADILSPPDGSAPNVRRALDAISTMRMALSRAPRPEEERKLDKPAMVGNTRFSVGVSERLVIDRAQREFEYQTTPEKEAERMGRVKAFVKAAQGDTCICGKCGVDRFKEPCPYQHSSPLNCPMHGTPLAVSPQRRAQTCDWCEQGIPQRTEPWGSVVHDLKHATALCTRGGMNVGERSK